MSQPPAPRSARFGSWASPIGADLVASGGVRLAQVSWSGDDLYWLEGRPAEGGRNALVRRSAGGVVDDVLPAGFNARTLVHEYGGGSYWLWRSRVFFANFEDQRLYRMTAGTPGSQPEPITPQPTLARGDRYADGVVTPDGRWVICVREHHEAGQEAVNEIVVLPADGSQVPRVLVSGHDFFSFPRLSPDGRRLAWTSWDHPHMPWDGTQLWLGDLNADMELAGTRQVAGGPEESVFQPAFSPDGRLHFVSDRTGWWNLYAEAEAEPAAEAAVEAGPGSAVALAPMAGECGVPQWVFGLATYAFTDDGQAFCLAGGPDGTRLSRVSDGQCQDLGLAYRSFSPASLVASGSRLAFIGGTPTQAGAVVIVDWPSLAQEVVRRSLSVVVDPALVSVPEAIQFPSSFDGGWPYGEGGDAAVQPTGHALYYPPRNPACAGPEGECPPLVVMSHGGPTSATSSELRLETQFLTSRGFAVVDVNYGGSTGYGRAYRERLKGRWGVLDVEDCIAAATFLAQRGDADATRLAIRGGSAGGYTTLCALTFRDTFAAGASYYGVADAETLALDTHKFESRYLDSLIGPYPQAKALYEERSPIHFTHLLSCPLIILQGLEDKIVPPSQAEEMVRALRAKGLPFAYLAFEGEQHGFRRAENILRALEAETYFYARVFGFQLAGDIPAIPIENL